MTLLDDRSAPTDLAGFRLWRLLDELRGGFDVVAAPDGIDRLVNGVTIWDPLRPPAPDDLVLVTTTRFTAAEAHQLFGAVPDAAAVVVKGVVDSPAVRRAAEQARVPLLAATGTLSWDDISTVARSLIPAARLLRNRAGDGLFALAEAAATLVEAPVEIADPEFRVLAFANLHYAVDQLRIDSIMARRAPAPAREWVGQRLRCVRTVSALDIPGAQPRLVAPIVVQDAVAGYVCAAADRAFTPDDERALAEIAAAAAASFVGRGDDPDLRHADLLRGVLDGDGALDVLAAQLGTTGPWTLIGLGPCGDLTAGTLASCARLLRPGSAATVLGETAYVLVPHRGRADTALAERLRSRCGSALAACVSGPFTADAAGVRHELDLGLTVQAAGEPATATLASLRPRTVIAELGEVARRHPSLLSGALDTLRRDGSPRDREYLSTLHTWFDAGCDVSEAAKRLSVHRNTVRYRLQRIEETCGVRLADPVARFTTELQVRLLFLAGLSAHRAR